MSDIDTATHPLKVSAILMWSLLIFIGVLMIYGRFFA